MLRKSIVHLIQAAFLAAWCSLVAAPCAIAQNVIGSGVWGDTKTGAAPASYRGPGDVYGQAYAWWGLRAFSAADRGNRLINICDPTKTTCADWSSDTTSGLLKVGTNPLNGTDCTVSTSCVVDAMYDRSGSTNCSGGVACDMSACASVCPTLNWNSGKPYLVFTGSASSGLQSFPLSNATAQTQPLSGSTVSEQTSNSGYGFIIAEDNFKVVIGANAANVLTMNAGSDQSITASDNVWHAGQFVFNAASSTFYVDGSGPTTVGASIGTNGMSTSNFTIGFDIAAIEYFTGNFREGGWWLGSFSSANQALVNTQQHSVWGF